MIRPVFEMTESELVALLVEHLVYAYRYQMGCPNGVIRALSLWYIPQLPEERYAGFNIESVASQWLKMRGEQ